MEKDRYPSQAWCFNKSYEQVTNILELIERFHRDGKLFPPGFFEKIENKRKLLTEVATPERVKSLEKLDYIISTAIKEDLEFFSPSSPSLKTMKAEVEKRVEDLYKRVKAKEEDILIEIEEPDFIHRLKYFTLKLASDGHFKSVRQMIEILYKLKRKQDLIAITTKDLYKKLLKTLEKKVTSPEVRADQEKQREILTTLDLIESHLKEKVSSNSFPLFSTSREVLKKKLNSIREKLQKTELPSLEKDEQKELSMVSIFDEEEAPLLEKEE